MGTLPPNLQYRGENGFIAVRVKVPPEARKLIGKRELTKGLGTSCISEAIRLSHDVIGRFNREIAEAMAKIGKPRRNIVMTLAIGNDAAPDWLQRAIMGAVAANADTLRITGPVANDPPLAGFTYEAGLQLWVASKGSEPPAPESVAVYRAHLTRLFRRLGHDEMGRVTEVDILDHPQVLLTGSDGEPPIKTNKTVNNHMASVRAVFREAKRQRKIASDPTIGTVKKLKVGESGRRGFTRDEHAKIIAHAWRCDDPAIKWLWLVGCTMGARIGELADATVEAVAFESGRWVFRIAKAYRRNLLPLKTRGSTRTVPLHSAILTGFLAYVEAIRSEHGDGAALFPMFEPNGHGRLSDAASAACMDWLRNVVGLYEGPNVLVFHSTRHAIKTYIRGRFDEEIHDAITGHVNGSVGRQYGETELAVLADAIELVKVAA